MASLQPRDLPSIDRLLQNARLATLPRELTLRAARDVLDEARRATRDGGWGFTLDDLPRLVEDRVADATRPRLRPVLNASGVIIHTNLGRAPLSPAALEAAATASTGYSNLEYDLDKGERGSRHNLVTDLLRRLTGADDALVTNNNAAAMLLILSALGNGREAIISRGQLVEIGGGFRIPDVMRQSGVNLVEVGTTNRTYAADFEAAITSETALLLRVHASNFLQVGFVHQPSLEELVSVGRVHGLAVVDDLGSGSLLDTARFGLGREPMVQSSVAAGMTLVAFSGDKLLGGPQAGIVVGAASEVGRLRRHPLMRAIRPDKLTLAALGATLLQYTRGEAESEVPVWRMIAAAPEELHTRAQTLADHLGGEVVQTGSAIGGGLLRAEVVPTRSAIGGGSLPGQTQPSWAVGLTHASADALAAALRRADPPVIARIDDGRVLLDLRSVLPEQDAQLEQSVRAML
ncbi:MAG: L-seryl-tRNA(Sec) selenium transferase [Chloroflexi bacterium]|nr:L-seryl-tRNA(Sec) selenium transferase [Chloroflexota bacterium]